VKEIGRLRIAVTAVPPAPGAAAGGAVRDDTLLGLRLCQRRFHVEPGLEARGLGEQRPHTRVVDLMIRSTSSLSTWSAPGVRVITCPIRTPKGRLVRWASMSCSE